MRNSVITYLIDTTGRLADKTAVHDESGIYSFAELLSNGCDLAQTISSLGYSGKPIGVLLHKSKEMIACFAGINLSGNFYIPLDTTQPESRLESILSTLDCPLVVTDSRNASKIPSRWSNRVVEIDSIFKNSREWQRAKEIIDATNVIDTNPVYSIFTSGSTGLPKGVVVNHRGVVDYIDWAIETFEIDESYTLGNQAPFYFDNSTLDIYLMYATGATLDIIPESKFVFPAKLIDYLEENKISFVFWVPFVLINIANFRLLDKRKPSFLKDVFFAGEVMPNKQLNYWRSRMPECRYVNLYGPTEITVDCTYYIVDRDFRDDEPLPIGKPCRNTDIIILKDRKTLCMEGETGEICVRGSSLACGYYNNPEKTAEAFIRNPLQPAYPETIYCTGDLGYFNNRGEVMFIGRADSQIKHKGYRIELGEIENAVVGSDLVEEGCIVYNHSKQRITLIYSNHTDITPSDLRRVLSDKIPAYMLPSVLIREEKMARNQNGKIDRAYYNKTVNG